MSGQPRKRRREEECPDEPGKSLAQVTLTQSAWAATNRKGSRLRARYHALRVRCGNKRAIVALGHTLLTIIHAVLTTRSPYREAPPREETEQEEQRAATYAV
jgi:hypothetical protein